METIIIFILLLSGNLMYIAKNIHDYIREKELSHLLLAALSITAVICLTIAIAVRFAQNAL